MSGFRVLASLDLAQPAFLSVGIGLHIATTVLSSGREEVLTLSLGPVFVGTLCAAGTVVVTS